MTLEHAGATYEFRAGMGSFARYEEEAGESVIAALREIEAQTSDGGTANGMFAGRIVKLFHACLRPQPDFEDACDMLDDLGADGLKLVIDTIGEAFGGEDPPKAPAKRKA